MEFLPAEFIRQRKKGTAASKADLQTFVQGYVRGDIPDYQMSAWLMAVCFQPLSSEETGWLTEAVADSGRRLHFRSAKSLSVDKHSTGGIGDKTSMILGPIVAAAGVNVPMIAGRGLGHTGGTLDKLESISGMSVRFDLDHFQKQVNDFGLCIIGQTEEICPADRKMYALRDVTGTVDSLPLICASIMSKKIAEGCEALVLDVKFGSGAFMKSLDDCEALAKALSAIGRAAGLKVTALLTNMQEPLGRYVGNALEIEECLAILKREKCTRPGKTWSDTEELSVELAAQMFLVSKRCATLEEAQKLAKSMLDTGKAYEKFAEMVRLQGGDLSKPLPKAKKQKTIIASNDGFVKYKDLEKMGLGSIVLGAGRKKSSDEIDFAAGLEVFAKDGAAVRKGDPLFQAFASTEEKIKEAEPFFQSSFELVDQKPTSHPLIAKVLK
jgi:pyrimidine-nucleoside phosphorylase